MQIIPVTTARTGFFHPLMLALAVLSVIGLTFGTSISSMSQAVAKHGINTIGLSGVAMKGYDPVAYFNDGAPRRGSKQFSLKHAGVEWRFASAEHQALFAANPDKYTPAYGGYCAYGVAKGVLVKIEPDAWAIRDGRLYLNYDLGVQRQWSKNPGAFISDADRKWPQLLSK